MEHEKVNILLVDDQPAKLLSYEIILRELGENLIQAASATQALDVLLKNDIAVVLVDVCMPDFDGFQLAAMIRQHPRFQQTAIIFISAIHLTETDYIRGYEMGGVDYVPVPVVPELLRAKVRVFAELHRKSRQLEQLNRELESRVAERTSELEASAASLIESERRRNLALAAGQMGSWDLDIVKGDWMWDEGQCRIFGVDVATFEVSLETVIPLVAPEDMARLKPSIDEFLRGEIKSYQAEFRVFRPDGAMRWCFGTATPTVDAMGRLVRVSGVTIDITERKQAEEKQLLLAREVDHRARNALAVVQSIVRLTKAKSQEAYAKAVEGRIQALAQAHTLLSESRWQGTDVERLLTEELAPYRGIDNARVQIEGPMVFLSPEKSQNFALVLHELATNSAKHGALSAAEGSLAIRWSVVGDKLVLSWEERGGPPVRPPRSQGFGTKIMNASIKRQIGGNVAWDWRPSGLHCTLHIPLTGDRLPDPPRPKNLVQLPSGMARRVLLAEDDAIIGVMMRELLSEHGMFVVGPCCSVKEALAAAEGDFDAAFLDVNLGDDSIYTVATRLKQRDIPFAFVTGYGKESLDGRFDSAPILQKPVTRENLESTLGALLSGDSRRPIAKPNPSSLKRA